MILKTLSMGKRHVYSVQKSYRNEDGKPSTKYVERLGTLEDLERHFGGEDPVRDHHAQAFGEEAQREILSVKSGHLH